MNNTIIVSYDGKFSPNFNNNYSNPICSTTCSVRHIDSKYCTYCLKCDVILLTPNLLKHCLLCNNCHYKHNIFCNHCKTCYNVTYNHNSEIIRHKKKCTMFCNFNK
jgi:hypothetical protein